MTYEFSYPEVIGIGAALASLYAANAKTIVPLRIAAVVANALALTYSGMHGTIPTMVLNTILLPLNAWRLRDMLKLIHDIDRAAKSDLNAEWLLPYMRPIAFKAGDFIMKRGDYAHGAYYVTAGEVEIVETGKTLGPATLLGEIALFAPDGLRTATVRAKTDVAAARIDYDRFKELYFQNPEFGFHLLHLIVARMQENQSQSRVAAT